MPFYYSPDFRERVVRNLLEKNITPTQLYKIFKISRNTAYLWLKKYKETGNLERSPGSGKKPKIDDLEKFKKILMKILMLHKKNWDNYVVVQANL